MQGAGLELHFVSFDDFHEVRSSAGLYFSHLQNFNVFELTSNDFVFVPGIDYELLSNKKYLKTKNSFFQWLKKQHLNKANICSICTGAFLLAEAGILNSKEATTHWKYIPEFQKEYPAVHLLTKRLFVVDENIYTSAGVSAGIDLALYILEKLYGTKFATAIAKEVVIYFRRGDADPQLSIYLEYRNHIEDRIHNVQDFLVTNIHNVFNLTDVSEAVHMSSRNLTRLFKKTTGITVGAYLEKLRVEKATQLLSENQKMEYVAGQCGLKSTNRLRALLKKHSNIFPTCIS